MRKCRANSIWLWVLAVAQAMVFVPPAGAVDPFYADKARGWFWREEPPEPPPAIEPEPLPPPAPVAPIEPSEPPEPANFSVDWFRKNLDGIRNRAIDEPTKENVLALLAAERIMRDKATRYAAVTQQVLKETPWLDENVRRPASAAGENLVEQRERAAIDRYGKMLGQQAGIWFFYKSDCPYCKEQLPSLEFLSERYGFTIMPIALDGLPLEGSRFANWRPDSGQAEALGVTVTPTLFLVRPPNDYAPLAYGLTPGDEIISRALDIGAEQGWLPREANTDQRHAQDVFDTAEFDFSAVPSDAPLTAQNPADLVSAVKRMLRTQ